MRPSLGTSEDKGRTSAPALGNVLSRMPCGFPAEINLSRDVAGLGKMALDDGYPPPPTPLKVLLGAGFAKNLGKI